MTSCDKEYYKSEEWIRNEAMKKAEDFVRSSLKNSRRDVAKNGSVIFSGKDVKCLVDPKYIITGKIDADSTKDAIVTVFTFNGANIPVKDHLIFINKNGKLELVKEYRGEMKFLGISNQVIFIEISHAAFDSPFADCQICKEIKKYKFVSGDTVPLK